MVRKLNKDEKEFNKYAKKFMRRFGEDPSTMKLEDGAVVTVRMNILDAMKLCLVTNKNLLPGINKKYYIDLYKEKFGEYPSAMILENTSRNNLIKAIDICLKVEKDILVELLDLFDMMKPENLMIGSGPFVKIAGFSDEKKKYMDDFKEKFGEYPPLMQLQGVRDKILFAAIDICFEVEKNILPDIFEYNTKRNRDILY